nr:folate synthesis bifunctional protein, mitochondrial-like [Ipomoea batatas]
MRQSLSLARGPAATVNPGATRPPVLLIDLYSRVIIDPGIGISKNTKQNCDILMGIQTIQTKIAKKGLAVSHAPLLVGHFPKEILTRMRNALSRPRGHSHPQGRDLARDLLRSFQYVFAYRELGYMATLTAMYSAMSF